MKNLENLYSRAKSAIERDEQIIYDVADNHGQIVDNVKHTIWFTLAVMQELIDTTKTYAHLNLEEKG